MSIMTNREAKRIALMNIVEGARADIDGNGSAYWTQHPEKGHDLSKEEREKVALAGKQILDVLERRAGRLRSFDGR